MASISLFRIVKLSSVGRFTCRTLSSYPPHLIVNMPALSPTMTMGTIGSWLKKVGDKVTPGDSIADIETDKASMSFEAQDEFYIAKLLIEPGKEVECGSPIMVTVEDEASISAFTNFSVTSAVIASPKPASLPAVVEVTPSAPAPMSKTAVIPVTPKPSPTPIVIPPVVSTPMLPSQVVPVSSSSADVIYAVRWGTGIAKSALVGKLSKDQLEYVRKYGSSGQQPI